MKKIKSFNFIKSICAIGIIIFHFSCYLVNTKFKPFYYFQNGNWGSTFVTVFFIVSGALLYHNYSSKMDIKKYYKKRWLAIFPMFYLAYISFEIGYIFLNKSLLYRGSITPYIFTILGMDGYFNGTFKTYYILGEWFLGVIILLYIIFPLILYLFKKKSNIVFILSIILYILFLGVPIINLEPFRSLPSCLVSFITGMILIKNKEKILNNKILVVSIISSLLLVLIKLPISDDIGNHLNGLFIFFILFIIGEKIMKNKTCDKIFTELSGLSYAIFLLQHIAILKILAAFNPASPLKVLILLIFTIILIIIEAKVLQIVTNLFVKNISEKIKQIKIKLQKR